MAMTKTMTKTTAGPLDGAKASDEDGGSSWQEGMSLL
jgi:hypothetical protein